MNEFLLALTMSLPYVKYGAYHWQPIWTNKPANVPKMQWGINSMKSLGLKVVRVPLGYSAANPFDNQPADGTNKFLLTMLQHPDYLALLDDPEIETIIFTSFTEQAFKQSASQIGQVDAWMNLDLEKERIEYEDAARFAGQRAPNKKIIFANWEADHEQPTTTNIHLFVGLMQARIDGIARADMPNVFSGIEIAITEGLVFPHLKAMAPDYLLYSMWEVLSPLVTNTSVSTLKTQTTTKLKIFKDLIGYNPDRIIVGEYGYEQDAVMPVFDFMKAMDEVFREFGIEIAIFWQTHWDVYNHGAYDVNGRILPIGRYLRYFAQRRIVTQVVEGKYCVPPSFGVPESTFNLPSKANY